MKSTDNLFDKHRFEPSQDLTKTVQTSQNLPAPQHMLSFGESPMMATKHQPQTNVDFSQGENAPAQDNFVKGGPSVPLLSIARTQDTQDQPLDFLPREMDIPNKQDASQTPKPATPSMGQNLFQASLTELTTNTVTPNLAGIDQVSPSSFIITPSISGSDAAVSQQISQVMSAPNLSKIADAIVTLRDSGGRIDVSLTPDDLGRLTLKLDQTTQGLQITFTADRLDTQDIIRRHIEVLQQQLRNSGLENLSMSFEHNQQERKNDGELKGTASAAYSGVIRPPVPIASGHPYRFDPAGDSGAPGHPHLGRI